MRELGKQTDVIDIEGLSGLDFNIEQSSYSQQGLELFDTNATVEAGSTVVSRLPLSHAIELRQIREDYDAEALEELADRMLFAFDDDSTPRIDLANPPTLNVLTRDQFEAFLDDHYDYYRIEDRQTVDDFPSFDGYYYPVINGHRRRRALYLKAEQLGVNPENVGVAYTLEFGLTFKDAKPKQYTENTYKALSPVEDARAIELHESWLKRNGHDSSVKVLEKVFGFKPDKIRDALRFVKAPEYIQKFVGNGLSYGNVIGFTKIRDAYENKLKLEYRAQYQAEIGALTRSTETTRHEIEELYFQNLAGVDAQAAESLRDYFETYIQKMLKEASPGIKPEIIAAKIDEINGSYAWSDESFLQDYDASGERRRARKDNRRKMGGAAVATLAYLRDQGDLSDDLRMQLQALLAANSNSSAKTEPEPTDVVVDLFSA